MQHTFDRTLLIFTVTLVVIGFLIFSSASLGLLAREGARFSSVALNQILFGIVGGGAALFLMSTVHYRWWRQYAFYIFLFSLILTLCVFVPGIGFSHGGAKRWIAIGSISLQPAELLKISFTIYMATWLSGMKHHIGSFKKGTLPFALFVGLVGIPFLLQPDTDSYLIMATASVAMFITAGGRIRDVIIMGFSGILLLAVLAFSRPYIMERLQTFINPANDPQGSGYQIKQSLIAVGSGGFIGRGFGQSIQKFEYLPEPIGDSIFAVYAEEFGFFGSVALLLLFAGFALRGYKIATRAPDLFGMLLVVGIVTIIITQTILNIAAMLGIAPLSGLPLPFISHGGTALLITLASVGIILNVSKYQKNFS
ncbi:MAG: putative lipid II flippase FtsW [Candidatus Pacebacteria bacterium]|nr:putative lipid II flippase FtsW [Candidatus Paceibacterota bacterium]MCF7857102.1 putative lipid II flippase FtsW [Candidatus Paceibacterota bacterium]